MKLVTVDGLPVPFERVHLLRGETPRYEDVADTEGHAAFYLVEGVRYDVAIEPFDHRVATRRGFGSASWTQLGSFVASGSVRTVAFVVR